MKLMHHVNKYSVCFVLNITFIESSKADRHLLFLAQALFNVNVWQYSSRHNISLLSPKLSDLATLQLLNLDKLFIITYYPWLVALSFVPKKGSKSIHIHHKDDIASIDILMSKHISFFFARICLMVHWLICAIRFTFST